MNCIVVDDEPLAIEGMKLNIQELSSLNLIGTFNTAMQANDFLTKNKVDLMFLDIQMPGLTGIEFLKILSNKPLTILTTAYPQFALEGFELDVVDYLLKPIRLERFVRAVNKAHEIYELREKATEIQEVKPEQNFIYIKSERKYVKLFFNDIRYIKGLKDYVVIHTKSEKVITAMNIKTIHQQLPEAIFARTSKSYIVNVNCIKAVHTDSLQIDKEEIPLGKTYKEPFIRNYIDQNLIDRNS
jgi:DNA-binding LytR/AlgR family response regulator